MKKFFAVCLSFTILAACSNDDDNANTGDDPIIGTWVVVQVTPPVINLTDCTEESTITFNENKTANGTFYLTATDCEAETSTGTWSNNGNSSYRIEVPFVGELPGTADFTGADSFTFSSTVVGQAATLYFERQE